MTFPVSASVSSRQIDPTELGSRLSDLEAKVSVESRGEWARQCVVRVDSDRSLATLTRLRDDESISMRRLVDLSAVDFLGGPPNGDAPTRFVLVYQLHSPTRHQRVRVEVPVEPGESIDEVEGPPTIDSVARIWPAAIGLEREVFDLFGIRFRGHPDLRRILLDQDFIGAPLRKDHPLRLDRVLPGEGDA